MFKRISKMNKNQLMEKKYEHEEQCSLYLSPRFAILVCFVGTILISIAIILSDYSDHDTLTRIAKAPLVAIITYFCSFFAVSQIAKFMSNYYSTLIDAVNVRTINQIFDNFDNGSSFDFNYCFEDFDRGDLVSVRYGKHAGDYIIKPFYDEKDGQMVIMVNSVGISFDDPRYKSANFSFSAKGVMSD